jgi:vanillate O-demethylase monooxygenase subunit
MFLTNYWYVVAWDYEIKQEPFARTVCGEPIVLYRKPDRSLAALEDCCPHRMLPLSKGRVKGELIVCGYHGIELDSTGQCVHMPNMERTPTGVRARAYPVAERHRFVWVWIGDPALADPARIPDLHWCSDPGWAFDGGAYHVGCDYRLLVDNLMDLTHETFVHPTSIGQQELSRAPIKTSSDEASATVTRWMHDIDPPSFWATNLKSNEKCDRWQIGTFTLPANVMIDVGVARAGTGAPQGNRAHGVTGIVVDVMTPESATSCWYYWGMARDFEVGDRGLTSRIKDAQSAVFAEDIEVLEAQQQNVLRWPGRELRNFNIDSGGVRARRLIDGELAKQSMRTQAE